MAGGFLNVISVQKFKELLAGFRPLPPEEVALSQALGRHLARPVVSGEDLPACNRSAMDGFAVRAEDIFGASETNPSYLERVAELRIEDTPDVAIGPGECAGIVTGGCLPPGADCVVMVEHTQLMGASTIEIRRSAPPLDHVILKGEDARAGEVALPEGRRLRPQEIGLLAGIGLLQAWVRPVPRVGILSTGDELVPAGTTPAPGQIRDVNSHALAAMVTAAGALPVPFGLVPDEELAIMDAVAQAVAGCDAVLVSGGSSVGARDLTIAAVERMPGSAILAHGVGLSPGKPTILARAEAGGRMIPILGLPGQVTSAQVVMHVLGLPLIRHLSGDLLAFAPSPSLVRARLARNVASKPGREDYVRVRLSQPDLARPENIDEPPMAWPILGKSGLLRTLVEADGLVRIPADVEGLRQGALVAVELL